MGEWGGAMRTGGVPASARPAPRGQGGYPNGAPLGRHPAHGRSPDLRPSAEPEPSRHAPTQ